MRQQIVEIAFSRVYIMSQTKILIRTEKEYLVKLNLMPMIIMTMTTMMMMPYYIFPSISFLKRTNFPSAT